MKTVLSSVVLCLAAHTATAQCVNSTSAAVGEAPRPVALIKTAAVATPAPSQIRQSPPAAGPRSADGSSEHRGTRAGTVLAALAVMSGIALRRFSASGQ